MPGIVYEGVVTLRETRESAVVATHPHVSPTIVAEAAHHISAEAFAPIGVGDEAFAHRREVVHAAIERAKPEAALAVAQDGIDELILQRLRSAPVNAHLVPRPGERVEGHHTLVATDEQAIGGRLQERVDVGGCTRERGSEHLLHPAIGREAQQSVFPCAYPQAAVGRLKHPMPPAVGISHPKTYGPKLIPGLVEPAQGGRTPCREGPHLIVGVDKHLSHISLQPTERKPLAPPVGSIVAEHTLPHRRHPHVAVAVFGKGVDLSRQLARDVGRETFGGLVEKEGPMPRTHEQPTLDDMERRDKLVGSQGGDAVVLHDVAVVAAEPVVGAKPNEAVLILHDIAHSIGAQAVFHGDVAHFSTTIESGKEKCPYHG